MLNLPAAWADLLATTTAQPYWTKLSEFVTQEYQTQAVYPPAEQLFTALELTPPNAVRAVILGQDPYHQPGQAHGLAFSVAPGIRLPPSLRNIFKELQSDLGVALPKSGDLRPWARQGVLLLNSALTVREGQAGSHSRCGWSEFTDAVIQQVSQLPGQRVFILWGAHAQAKRKLLDTRHAVLESVHPSPLSAKGGFFGSRPFSRCNALLESWGQTPIDWQLN